ncbi:hypothetical protein [Chengkuizengella sediminis]|uniref:hypothetical protein n=1 Tax=Chengkuizengella sediminis TaxID=1885917 RepID=UPI00138A489A|nr:hypothetical protein [Chengkuizengella sediminis]NDI34824.1 hypothetical protein [Chengkuizengella sediminis]
MIVNMIKQGWKTTNQNIVYILLFSMYQLVWGIFLYRWIESVIVSISQRFPDPNIMDARQLFIIEGQYLITDGDFMMKYFAPLLIFIGIRWIVSPLMNAGLYYAIHHKESHSSKPLFLQGVFKLGSSFFIISCIHLLLSSIPLYWIFSFLKNTLETYTTPNSLLWNVAPILMAYIVYAWIIHILFMYIQWGKTTNNNIVSPIVFMLKNLIITIGLSLIITIIIGVFTALFFSVSILWVSFFAIIVNQIQYFIRVYLKVWEINTQYHFWLHKKEPQ